MDCISEGSDDVLRARIEDTLRLCDKRGTPCFLGFLDLREQATARCILTSMTKLEGFAFFGGYSEAERCFLSVFPDYYSEDMCDYPLRCVAFRYRMQKEITHRDVLGTLMSIGIRRDAVGDILCGKGFSVVFLRSDITDYVCEQIDRIGGEGVTIVADYTGELPLSVHYEPIRETVASPRLDSVVKALIHCSREKAADLIRVGAVSIDHRPVESVSACVAADATVSVRGYGRFLIQQIGPETKKGRLTLLAGKRV